jgi:hypothetical protein
MRWAVGHAEHPTHHEAPQSAVAVLPSTPRVEPSNYLRQEAFHSMHTRKYAFVDLASLRNITIIHFYDQPVWETAMLVYERLRREHITVREDLSSRVGSTVVEVHPLLQTDLSHLLNRTGLLL